MQPCAQCIACLTARSSVNAMRCNAYKAHSTQCVWSNTGAARAKKPYADKLEGRDRVPRAVAICLIGSSLCAGYGRCALRVQIEDMHSAFIAGHCYELRHVSSRESYAENGGWVCASPELLQ